MLTYIHAYTPLEVGDPCGGLADWHTAPHNNPPPNKTGEARTRVFLWPYTDLYKWTILSQKGKIALQLTVFASDDYARRTEFIFRTRNAPRYVLR